MTGSLALSSGGTINGYSGKIRLKTDSIVPDIGESINLLTCFEDIDLDNS